MVPVSIFIYLFNRFYYVYTFSFAQFLEYLTSLPLSWYLVLVVCLIINWGLESYKWKFLVSRLESINYKDTVKSVLSGVAVSQLLPYRTGEYLGRLAYISDKNKIEATALSIVGSYSQLLITLVFGLVASVPALVNFVPQLTENAKILLLITAVVLLVIMIWLYLNLHRLNVLKRFFLFRKMQDALKLLSRRDLARLSAVSALRYFSFVIPYALLADYYDVGAQHPLMHYIAIVMTIYFLLAASPVFFFTDLTLRMAIPLLLFDFSASRNHALIPGLLIYLFNVVIPMCVGAVILMLAKIRK